MKFRKTFEVEYESENVDYFNEENVAGLLSGRKIKIIQDKSINVREIAIRRMDTDYEYPEDDE